MSKYTYKPENGIFRIFKDGEPLSTYEGHPVIADTEDFAIQVVKEFEFDDDHLSTDSYATYHYAYCDFKDVYKAKENLEADLCMMASAERLFYDRYLMFGGEFPEIKKNAIYFSMALPPFYKLLDFRQLSAIGALYPFTESLLYPYYICNNVLLTSVRTGEGYEKTRDKFAEELLAFEEPEGDKELRLDVIKGTVDAFSAYFNPERYGRQ